MLNAHYTDSIGTHIVCQDGKELLISPESLPQVDAIDGTWTKHPAGYGIACIGGHTTYLHRLLLGFPPKRLPDGTRTVVDHKNGNASDNRLENLQLTTYADNNAKKVLSDLPSITNKTSGHRNVFRDKQSGLWKVRVAGKNLGLFPTIEAASKAAREERHRHNVRNVGPNWEQVVRTKVTYERSPKWRCEQQR